MTVFVVHPIRQDDISAAAKWGSFRFVNERYVYGDELDANLTSLHYEIPTEIAHNLDQAALEFQEHDYLLIAGDHLQLLQFMGGVARRFASVNVLRFDKKISDYIPVRLHMGIARRVGPMLLSPFDPLRQAPAWRDIGERHGQDSRESEAERAHRKAGEPRSTEYTKSLYEGGD